MLRGGLVVAALVAASLAAAVPVQGAGRASVAALQVALLAKGLYHAPIDGVRGPRTTAALRGFQRRAGLRVDGIVGPRTRRALGRLGRHHLGSRPLRPGLVGWDVAALQFELARHGFGAGFDGVFGDVTEAELREYQRYEGLIVDGVAGPATLGSLRRAASVPFPLGGKSVGVRAVEVAEHYFGVPYVWAGDSPAGGFDCSGLVQYVYGQLGVPLLHGTRWQLQAGQPVARSRLNAGDLVFFEQTGRGPRHVGIYVGRGWLIEAPHTGDVVRLSRLNILSRVLGYVGATRPSR